MTTAAVRAQLPAREYLDPKIVKEEMLRFAKLGAELESDTDETMKKFQVHDVIQCNYHELRGNRVLFSFQGWVETVVGKMLVCVRNESPKCRHRFIAHRDQCKLIQRAATGRPEASTAQVGPGVDAPSMLWGGGN